MTGHEADDAEALGGAADVSRFLVGLCHDLRQSAHAIGLHLSPLAKLSESAADESVQRAVAGIRASWQAMDQLLSQVLDLTQLESGSVKVELRPVEVAPLVQSLIAQHSAIAERAGVRLVALVSEGRCVRADELMLWRVLSNLLDNAIRFSPAGAQVLVALRYARSAWRLQVRNGGAGIALDEQRRIFAVFRQLAASSGESQLRPGLGLAICRRLVVLMNGSIAVRSAPGRGCCMTVTLAK